MQPPFATIKHKFPEQYFAEKYVKVLKTTSLSPLTSHKLSIDSKSSAEISNPVKLHDG